MIYVFGEYITVHELNTKTLCNTEQLGSEFVNDFTKGCDLIPNYNSNQDLYMKL